MPSRATKFRFHSFRASQEKTPRASSPSGRDEGDEDHLVDLRTSYQPSAFAIRLPTSLSRV